MNEVFANWFCRGRIIEIYSPEDFDFALSQEVNYKKPKQISFQGCEPCVYLLFRCLEGKQY